MTLDPKPEALNPLIQVRLDGGRPVTAAAAIGGEGYAGMFQKQVKVNEKTHKPSNSKSHTPNPSPTFGLGDKRRGWGRVKDDEP